MRTIVMLAVTALWGATCARADFVVRNESGQASPTQQAPASAAPVGGNGAGEGNEQTGLTPRRTPAAPGLKMAYGFGDQVPLAFACRQIVPPAVRVTYGPGATPDQLVSWKGGDTWNHVLRDAVRPLGLRLLMTQTAVEIRR